MSAHHPAIVAAVTKKHIADAEAAAKAAGPRLTPEDAPWHDWAKDILSNAPVMADEARADAWQHFYESRDHHELASRLSGIPPETAASLVEAKRALMPTPTSLDKVVGAIHHLATIDSDTLDLAEKHPQVLKALVDSVQKKREA